MKKRIVIVGGGISGLATAFYLSRHLAQQPDAAQITLLESKDRFGGSIQTQMQDGFLMEGGSDSFLSDKPWGTQLCEDLGITSHLISTQVMNRRSFVYLKNRLIDVPKGFYLFAPVRIRTMLATPLFSWPGKFRMGLEPFIPARKNLGDESVGSFVRRRLGQEALDRMGQPMLSGIYSADPEKLSLEATMPRFLELERNFGSLYKGLKAQSPQRSSSTSQASGPRYSLFLSLREGMESLVKEILNQLPSVELKTGSEVTSINNHQGWQVVLADGTKIETDFLCLAMPAHIASRLLINADTNVSGQLNDIPYESVGTVNVAYRNSDLKRSLNGSGFVV
ncbi:MAG: protoporphyrinogen oxidase, partial [Chlamydiota bacterium]|nr:protoporphyrinogen oxidase [Chlamydiota bacterium]